MNLGHRNREMTAARKQAEEKFTARLQASGHERGVFAAKKGDTEGELLIYDVIGEDFWTGAGVTATDVAAKLDAMKGVSRLTIYINSPGGNVWEGKAIYNQIARFAAEKIVRVDGIAASAASLIAMAGDKIVTEEGGTWLIHEVANPWTNGRGTAGDHEKMAAEIRAETAAIMGVYEQRTKCPAEKMAELMARDEIITAAEAKSYGLTDEISAVEQKRLDQKQAQAQRITAERASLSLESRFALVAAKAQQRTERFPKASLGAKPGEPGIKSAANPPALAGKEK